MATDLFVVPTVTFRLLFVLVIAVCALHDAATSAIHRRDRSLNDLPLRAQRIRKRERRDRKDESHATRKLHSLAVL